MDSDKLEKYFDQLQEEAIRRVMIEVERIYKFHWTLYHFHTKGILFINSSEERQIEYGSVLFPLDKLPSDVWRYKSTDESEEIDKQLNYMLGNLGPN